MSLEPTSRDNYKSTINIYPEREYHVYFIPQLSSEKTKETG